MNEISTPLDKEVATLGSSSEDEAILAPRGRRAKATPAILSSDESSGSHLAPEPVTPKKRARPQRGFHISTNGSTIGSSSEKPRRKLGEKLSPSPSSATATSHKGHITEDVADKSPKATLSRPANTFVISSGSDQSSSEDDVITPARKRRPTLQSSKKVQDERSGSEESGELAGEVADLSDTGMYHLFTMNSENQGSMHDFGLKLKCHCIVELQGRRTRGHQANSERSKRQRRLEELRQRRAGVRVDTDEESVESPDEDESQDGLETIEQAMGRRENLNEYEDDFVDDEEDAIGVDLGVAGVPLKYTYHANKKPFEHFKTEIEWMVHNKLNPAFDRRDEIYLLAHDKLDKEVEGYGKSKFESSVWKEPFLKALKSRPDFDNFDVPTMLEHKCDACQRSNHPPKHRVTFTGKPYDRDTLEPITNDDEEDESESDEEEDDSRGSSDEQESFFLGRYEMNESLNCRLSSIANVRRFCCANAEMVHALHHWRWHLNQTVLLWLGTDGHLTPEKIVERESMRQKKREKEANRVVDGMESTGVMKELYCQFKQNLAAARDAKVSDI